MLRSLRRLKWCSKRSSYPYLKSFISVSLKIKIIEAQYFIFAHACGQFMDLFLLLLFIYFKGKEKNFMYTSFFPCFQHLKEKSVLVQVSSYKLLLTGIINPYVEAAVPYTRGLKDMVRYNHFCSILLLFSVILYSTFPFITNILRSSQNLFIL